MNLKQFRRDLPGLLGFVAALTVILAIVALVGNARQIWYGLPWNQFPPGSHCLVPNETWGASDLKTYDELSKAMRIGDSIGVQELVAKGRAALIQAQTSVLVLSIDAERWDWFFSPYRQVRILEGLGSGKAMWIRKDALAFSVPQTK